MPQGSDEGIMLLCSVGEGGKVKSDAVCESQRASSHWVACCAGPKMSDFRSLLSAELPAEVVELGKDVEEFAKQFPTVGFEKATMRYTD